jgi:hypothetical protein
MIKNRYLGVKKTEKCQKKAKNVDGKIPAADFKTTYLAFFEKKVVTGLR